MAFGASARTAPPFEEDAQADRTLEQVSDPADALAIVLDRTGRVDVDQIAQLLNTVDEPATWVSAAEYLSGNVRIRLDQAQAAELADQGRWTAHVKALEAVQPPALMAGDVVARVGAVWIPDSDHEAFIQYLLDEPRATVRHIGANEWSVDAGVWSTAARNTWGTRALPAPKLFAKMLTQSPMAGSRTRRNTVLRNDSED